MVCLIELMPLSCHEMNAARSGLPGIDDLAGPTAGAISAMPCWHDLGSICNLTVESVISMHADCESVWAGVVDGQGQDGGQCAAYAKTEVNHCHFPSCLHVPLMAAMGRLPSICMSFAQTSDPSYGKD